MNIVLLLNVVVFTQAFVHNDLFALVTQESQICRSPDGLPLPYSGFRVYQVLMLDWPVRHFWYVARCSQGTVAEQQFFPTNRTSNFMFGEPLCLGRSECYVVSRRRKYAQRNSLVYRPFATVGALYSYDPATDATTALTSLKSDSASASSTLTFAPGKKVRLTPLLFSPSGLLGSNTVKDNDISPFENYTFSDAETHESWWKVNELVNKMTAALSVRDDVVFWEFDALQKNLCREMGWRETMNNLLVAPGENATADATQSISKEM